MWWCLIIIELALIESINSIISVPWLEDVDGDGEAIIVLSCGCKTDQHHRRLPISLSRVYVNTHIVISLLPNKHITTTLVRRSSKSASINTYFAGRAGEAMGAKSL